MNYLFINHSVPSRHANGGPATIYALIEAAIKSGHVVTVIAIAYSDIEDQDVKYIDELEKLGAKVYSYYLRDDVQVPLSKFRGYLSGAIFFKVTWKAFYNSYSPQLAKLIDDIKPDKVICYHWDSLALASNLDKHHIVGLLGDPINAPPYRQCKYLLFSCRVFEFKVLLRFVYFSLLNILARRVTRHLLLKCKHVISFQYGECSLYKSLGFDSADYLPTPISDSVAQVGYHFTRIKNANVRFRVLLGPSNLNATVTRAGLSYFCVNILPCLLKRYGEDFFEFRIVGEGSATDIFASHLNKGYLTFTGRVEPPDTEFLNADLQLSLTPFKLGNRVRVSTGMMYGCPIIVSSCEAFNIQELKHGHNCLIGNSAHDIFNCVVDVIEYPGLRDSLSEASRTTYLKYNLPSIVWDRLTTLCNGV